MNPNDPNNPQNTPAPQTPELNPQPPQPGAQQESYAAPPTPEPQPQQPAAPTPPAQSAPGPEMPTATQNPFAPNSAPPASADTPPQPESPFANIQEAREQQQADNAYAQPQAFGAAPASSSGGGKKFPAKIIGVILAGLAGVALLAGAAWLIMNFVGGPRLQAYEGSGYAIGVPQEWDTEETGQRAVRFTPPDADTNGDDPVSSISVNVMSNIPDEYRDEYASFVTGMYTEASMAAIIDYDVDNYYVDEDIEHAGMDGWQATVDITEDDSVIGRYTVQILYGDGEFYIITVSAYDDEIMGATARIINSFAVVEESDTDDED